MSDFFTGIIGIAIFVALACLVIAWLIFPFIVISKFNELLKVEKDALTELRLIKSQLQENAKAIQYLIDRSADR